MSLLFIVTFCCNVKNLLLFSRLLLAVTFICIYRIKLIFVVLIYWNMILHYVLVRSFISVSNCYMIEHFVMIILKSWLRCVFKKRKFC